MGSLLFRVTTLDPLTFVAVANTLSRHIKPAARKMGLEFVNWCCLRTSHATWLKWPARM